MKLKFKKAVNYLFYLTIFSISMSSCVWRHVTPTHNTPHFTSKRQFEGSYAFGLTGANINLAYSPFKFYFLQLNACSSLLDATAFNNQLEVAMGGYMPVNRVVFGLSGGFGQGATAWNRWWYAKESSAELKYAKFDTRKFYIDGYFSYKWLNESGFSGISTKFNFLNDFYYTSNSDGGALKKTNYYQKRISVEVAGFAKIKIAKVTYFNVNVGLGVYPGSSREATGYPIGTIGLLHKF